MVDRAGIGDAMPLGDGPEIRLQELDHDGAILGGIDGLYGSSRAEFLAKAAFGSAALLTALAMPPGASAKSDPTEILNFDLVFEYLQSSFYTEADKVGTVKSMNSESELWARTLGAHERAHVRILKSVLGSKAAKKPSFNFGGVTDDPDSFVKTAVAMEDLTVALLAGQAPRFDSRELTAAVFSLLTVEARHAAWARRIRGYIPVAAAFDRPKSISEVGRVVAATHFVQRRPQTATRKRPRFTG
jgi:hypothetical protein